MRGWKNYIDSNDELRIAVEVLNKLEQNNKNKAYIVGGAVRDIILGEEINDVDIATNCPMDKIEDMFDTYDIGKNKDFGIVVVKYKNFDFEISQFREDGKYLDGRRPETINIISDFKNDAKRRDFTINAMAVDKKGNIVDYFNGNEDIKNKTIKTVGNPNKRFSEDYLRMLRAVRFSSRLGYDIDKDTKKAIRKNASKISNISQERITKEILKMAKQSGDKFAQSILTLKETGLLKYILPEILQMDDFEHMVSSHPEGAKVRKIIRRK